MPTITLIEAPIPSACVGKIDFEWNADLKDSFVRIRSNIPRDVWGAKRYDGKRNVYHLVLGRWELLNARDAREVWANLVKESWTVKVEDATT